MMEEEHFISIAGLLCEPARAKMLWNLLDGRAYTATELAAAAEISATSASNHLSKLLEADLLKVDTQGRHRYYSFARPEVAYVIESLAQLAGGNQGKVKTEARGRGVSYCRSCYDHLAGWVGVRLTEALESQGFLQKSEQGYHLTDAGWKSLSGLNISPADLPKTRRPFARQCLDWSERRPHLAGQLGAVLLERMLQRSWFRKVQFSRELVLTSKGRQELNEWLDIDV